mmetsp:Transcript_31678/g.31126  ORF Transcript_31678/g.31126 Transcript_31678/m.31126 type:complete len:131 (-) Transcript_31678:219-611(-)
MWKNGKIICPNCNSENLVAGMKDLPHTNFSLLKLMQGIKMKKGYEKIADKYKVVNVDNILKIKEFIDRESNPKVLILHGLYGSETMYKEEIFDDSIEPRMYSVNSNSFLINYLGLNIETSNIWALRKYKT